MKGIAAAFRIIPQKIMTLEEMNAPDGVYKLANKKKGLVLVTGPTGSGKSTTLYCALNQMDGVYNDVLHRGDREVLDEINANVMEILSRLQLEEEVLDGGW
jgi:twitching motility protein PilT